MAGLNSKLDPFSESVRQALNLNPLPAEGYVRVSQIVGDPGATPPIPPIIPISKSGWWSGVREGRYPKPVRTLGKRITAWRVEDIRELIAQTGKAA